MAAPRTSLHLVVSLLALVGGCRRAEPEDRPPAAEAPSAAATEAFAPVPPPPPLPGGKVRLGRRLFRDPGLSADGTIACATCHRADRGGADGLPRPVGRGGAVGRLNTPTVWNSGQSLSQFWDGRAATLEAQVDGPLTSAAEMGATWDAVLGRLRADRGYAAAFAALYPDGVTAANVRDAIGTYERSLVTPDARFDRFLRGDAAALSADEEAGYQLFRRFGCASCHQGANIGGNMFQRMGVVQDYFADRGDVSEADLGRYNVTRREEDRHVFKVPSLRNVALTAPYFHDGSAPTLEVAVAKMARYQLGRHMAPEDRRLIVAFLRTLTGQAPAGEAAP